MKILLIIPSDDDLEFITSFVATQTDVYPHLGISYIASVAEKNGHNVRILDNRFHPLNEIEDAIKEFNPDVIGITATCFTIKNLLKISQFAKIFNKNIVIVVGGPIVDIYPKEIIGHDTIDIACFGEGDFVFSEILNSLEKNLDLKNVKGIGFKRDGEVILTDPSPIITEVNKIPFPARNLLENDKYFCALTKQLPVTTLISSRGCPFNCTYCLKFPSFRRMFRPRSPKDVVDEIEECQKMGFKEIFFFDDTFSANIARAKEICREIIKRKLSIVWDIRTRVDCVDMELLKLLKESNCVRIHYGVEVGDPYILETLKKGINLEQAKQAFKMTKEVGIITFAYFMLGVPMDTIDTINRSIDFAIKLNPDFVVFSPFMNLPGTETYDYSLKKNILKTDIWRDYISGKVDKVETNSIYLLENIDAETMRKTAFNAYRRFYFRPRKLLEIVSRIRSLDEFMRAANVGISILRGVK